MERLAQRRALKLQTLLIPSAINLAGSARAGFISEPAQRSERITPSTIILLCPTAPSHRRAGLRVRAPP